MINKYTNCEVVIRDSEGHEVFGPVAIPDPTEKSLCHHQYGEFNDYEEKIALYNRAASALLAENERIFREEGNINIPVENVNFSADDGFFRLHFPPKGYMRSRVDFNSRYNIDAIFGSYSEEDQNYNNMVYYLQMTDYYNYTMNRVNLWGPIKEIVYKNAFISVVALIEAFLQEAVNNCYAYCRTHQKDDPEVNGKPCRDRDTCNKCFYSLCRKADYVKAKEICKFLKTNNMLGMTNSRREIVDLGLDNPYDVLYVLFNRRNEIHIRQKNTIVYEGVSDIDWYNLAILMLKDVSDKCVKNMTPYYTSCRYEAEED